MRKQFPFEKLEVWQEARKLVTNAQETDPILHQAYDLAVRIHNLRDSQIRRAQEL